MSRLGISPAVINTQQHAGTNDPSDFFQAYVLLLHALRG